MINCKKAAYLMDKKDFEDLSVKEKIGLWRHNLFCKACKKYAQFSKKFKAAFKKEKMNPPKLSEAEKEKMKDKLASGNLN